MKVPNLFVPGFQKTATTWLHRCFLEHPDIFVPQEDGIHYFTINYHRGEDWYNRFFADYNGESVIADTTPSYARFSWSRERLAAFNPNAKILVVLRNPIERAFSHYWHEKKKRTINWNFSDVLTNNVDIFDSWVATGFYSHHIEALWQLFSADRVKIAVYDDLVADPKDYVQDIFSFLEVDASFEPTVLREKLNVGARRPPYKQQILHLLRGKPRRSPTEYIHGINLNVRRELKQIYKPEIGKLQRLTNRDFSHWLDDPG